MAPITLAYYAGSADGRWRGPTPGRGIRSRWQSTPAATARSTQWVTDFCERYADHNEQDYGEFGMAVRSGRLEAVEGVLSIH